jgi:UDP-N-acetylglucosamine 2-epimerase
MLRKLIGKRLVLVTTHRRENIGAPLSRIAAALAVLAQTHEDVHFILPVHKNPKVEEIVRAKLSGIENFHLVEPLHYRDLVSGGIQEEAPSLAKPVLVLRNDTERPEAIQFGTSIMVGSDAERIISIASDFLGKRRVLRPMGEPNPYGDGRAAARIVDNLLASLLT